LFGLFSTESIYSTKKNNKDLSLQEWFKKLLNHEKAIALTIIDTDLVNLIKQMFESYATYGHGFFTGGYPLSA